MKLPFPGDPFRIAVKGRYGAERVLALPVRGAERLSGLAALSAGYACLRGAADSRDFLSGALAALSVSYSFSSEAAEEIPRQGPVVVVANHPFGGLEGIVLLHLLRGIRPDVRVMGNHLLSRVPEMRQYLIPVDPFASKISAVRNRRPLRETLRWLQSGGLLLVFPAGAVSSFDVRTREVTDPQWSGKVGGIIRTAKAKVVPVFVHGRNGLVFQISGLFSPRLRTFQLPRQLWNKRGKTIRVEIGRHITEERLQSFCSDADLMSYLRLRTYVLRSRAERVPAVAKKHARRMSGMEPVVPSVDASLLHAEIEKLPPSQILAEQSNFVVAYATASQTPAVLREIGRLRELAFRGAGEGTGRSTDLDRFDEHYLHLFAWNAQAKEIIGAYRLADARAVADEMGLKGLYSHTLFDYDAGLLQQLGGCLELGRSFVREEYQRSASSLHLLWKGICRYVLRHPVYHGLFGTVSISADYDSFSRQLMVAFLQSSSFAPELAERIRPRNPFRRTRLSGIDEKTIGRVVRNITEVSELIAEIEEKGKGIPVLLRHYLKLGGKLLGFNIDPDFGNALDGLIYVDLREAETSRILERYMESGGLRWYLNYHGRGRQIETPEPAAA